MDLIDGVQTQTASQEQILLQADKKNNPTTISIAPNVEQSTISQPLTNFARPDQLIEANENAVDGGMLISLQTARNTTETDSSITRRFLAQHI